MSGLRQTRPALLGLALAASLALNACGSGGGAGDAASPSTSAGPTTEASKQPEASKLEPYTISLFVPGVPQKDQALVNEEISHYLKSKINASLDMTVFDWGSWKDKMNLKFASNEAFDLMYTASWDGWTTKVQNGSVIPLDDLMKKYAQEAMAQLDPMVLEGIKFNGKTYGFPTNKEFAGNKGVLVRKDLVDKYKFDLSTVKKPEDLEPFFEVIKKNEPGMTPFLSGKDVGLDLVLMDNSFVGSGSVAKNLGLMDHDTKELKVIDAYNDPRYMAILKLARKWYMAGYINKDAPTLADFTGAYRSGKVFAYPESLKPGKDAEVSQATGLPWVQVEFTRPIVSTSSTLGAMLSISRTSKDPARAMMFLNLLHTDKKLVNMIAFGIEGKHYVKKDEKTIDYPSGVTSQTSGYALGAAYMFGNQFNNYLWANEDPQKWDKFRKFNGSAESAKSIGFNFDPEKVKNEISAYNNKVKEYLSGLITGAVDPEKYLPEMVKELKAAGMDAINAEVQRQLDQWSAAVGKK